jgi:hypothetical protein
MKATRNFLLALALLLAVAPMAASAQISVSAGINIGPSGRASVDLGFFYDNLASYGNWIQRPSYGWVWTPRAVDNGWRPYQDGRWVWTDQGWTWISDEPYGWATYHYGRWYEDPDLGWSWVPGDQWAPAWVDWQAGEDYVGWAPLPPGYDIGGGYGYGSSGYRLAPESYVFVQERYFLAPRITSYVLPRQQVVTIFGRTRNYTSYRVSNNLVYNQGIPVDRIQRVVGRAVPRYQVADLGATEARQRTARISGNRVEIFRPQVRRNVQVAPPASRPVARRSVVTATEFQQRYPNRANRAARTPRVQGTPAPNPTIQGQRRQDTRGKTWDQVQAERRQQRQVQPQVQPPTVNPRNRNQQDRQPQVQSERQRRNDTPAVQAQPRAPQRQDQYQRPPQRQQQPPQVQPQPNRGNNRENPGAQGPKDKDKNNRGKAHQQQKDRKDRNRDRDQNQGPPPIR